MIQGFTGVPLRFLIFLVCWVRKIITCIWLPSAVFLIYICAPGFLLSASLLQTAESFERAQPVKLGIKYIKPSSSLGSFFENVPLMIEAGRHMSGCGGVWFRAKPTVRHQKKKGEKVLMCLKAVIALRDGGCTKAIHLSVKWPDELRCLVPYCIYTIYFMLYSTYTRLGCFVAQGCALCSYKCGQQLDHERWPQPTLAMPQLVCAQEENRAQNEEM